ncbi:hypothetical protein LR48_Vigan07g151300 [Vigna angularis]|uniref:Uncharacterized protein n=1 Tax=Phaseolus angularis TaxID=3914 RepID=A0A0L9UZ27_PHAAN|nr:hypothetical protein LR48_Vigan07g151300 [Vigna angularis]
MHKSFDLVLVGWEERTNKTIEVMVDENSCQLLGADVGIKLKSKTAAAATGAATVATVATGVAATVTGVAATATGVAPAATGAAVAVQAAVKNLKC